jgi:hypothetical protein
MSEYSATGKYHPSSITNRFHGWTNALREAGLTILHFNGGVLPEDAIKDLQAVSAKLGKRAVTQVEYSERGKWSPKPLIRVYGSWSKALSAAGLEPSRAYRVSDEALFGNLERMWRSLGRQPRYGEVIKPFSGYSSGTYEHRFGSWRKALEAFVASVNAEVEPELAETEPSPSSSAPVSETRRQASRTINWRLRFLVLQRDGFRCRLCGASPATQAGVQLQVDHIVPWSKGGETTLDNLQTACERCNIGKSNSVPRTTTDNAMS